MNPDLEWNASFFDEPVTFSFLSLHSPFINKLDSLLLLWVEYLYLCVNEAPYHFTET